MLRVDLPVWILSFLLLLLHQSPFADAQHAVIVPLHMEIRRQVKENLRCNGMNSTTIIIVPTTIETFELAMIQRHGLHSRIEAKEDAHCLAAKWITVCLDKACLEKCHLERVAHCTVYFPINVHDEHLAAGHHSSGTEIVPESAKPLFFASGVPGSQEWRRITSLKWEFIGIALKMGAETVMHVDCDILVLKNPFLQLIEYHGEKQVLHLSETKDNTDNKAKLSGTWNGERHPCQDAQVHSGLLIVSTSTRNYKYRIIQLVNRMLDPKNHERIISGAALEQQVLGEAMKELDVSHCALPKETFAGHCPHAHADHIDVSHLVTYHAHCTADIGEKENLMKKVIQVMGLRKPGAALNVDDLFQN